MIKVYRGKAGDTQPVEMWCETFGYPNKTNCGEMMYNNTHFKTKKEAWSSILMLVDAEVLTAGNHVKEAEKRLRFFQKKAAAASKEYAEAYANFRKYNNKFDESWERAEKIADIFSSFRSELE